VCGRRRRDETTSLRLDQPRNGPRHLMTSEEERQSAFRD
jgi:hypothetical protein